jgi:hypothetical protein
VKIESGCARKVSEVNLIAMEKWLDQIVEGYRECRRMREGDLVLLTRTKAQAERMCNRTRDENGRKNKDNGKPKHIQRYSLQPGAFKHPARDR